MLVELVSLTSLNFFHQYSTSLNATQGGTTRLIFSVCVVLVIVTCPNAKTMIHLLLGLKLLVTLKDHGVVFVAFSLIDISEMSVLIS